MALRLITSSPRRTAVLPPLRPGKSNAPRCIDASVATSGPHAFAVRSRAVRYRHYQRPPRPVPTIVTIMIRPSGGTGWAKIYRRFNFCKSEIFLILGLDMTSENRKQAICSSGQFVALARNDEESRESCIALLIEKSNRPIEKSND